MNHIQIPALGFIFYYEVLYWFHAQACNHYFRVSTLENTTTPRWREKKHF